MTKLGAEPFDRCSGSLFLEVVRPSKARRISVDALQRLCGRRSVSRVSHCRMAAVASIALLFVASFSLAAAHANAIEITIPRRSRLTPVQKLNREGVKAVQKHDYSKAEALFLKAYLYDPSDPFTLNNLGYISELENNPARAEKLYKLSAEQQSGAEIALSSVKQLKGQPMDVALANLREIPMEVNHWNLEAVRLIRQGRNVQAIGLLKKALAVEPHNAFTLNNLGVANEALGNFAAALKNYNASAESPGGSQTVVVALSRSSEGQPIGELARKSAERLEARLARTGTVHAEAAALSVSGVAAANQNDWSAARKDFLKAYSLDPASGFALNNRGYVAEREGDLETAQFFYDKARLAANAGTTVGLATAQAAEGRRIREVAVASSQKVGAELEIYSAERRQQTGPVELIPRGAAQPKVSPRSANQKPAGQNQTIHEKAPQQSSPGSAQPK